MVFDSIEGLGNVNINTIAKLYQEASKKLLGKLGITRILIGDTHYGLTPDIINYLQLEETSKPAKMVDKVKYTDAKEQVLLVK